MLLMKVRALGRALIQPSPVNDVEQLNASDIQWADMVFATAMLVQKDSLRQVIAQCMALCK